MSETALSIQHNQVENKIITAEYQEATALHCKIMANAEIAASALLEMCCSLKEMRDKKLYLQLDMPTFDMYCEEKVGIKARQAYTYISTYEKLGSTVLRSNANLGITKLELIAQLPAPDRANNLADGKFEGMSVKEIKELVKKSKEQAEQLESLFSKNELLQNKVEQSEEKYLRLMNNSTKESLELENKISELNKKIVDLESRPIEVAVAEPSAEDIEKIRQQIRTELEAETFTQSDVDKAVEEAVKKAVEDEQSKAKQTIAQEIEKLKAEKSQAENAAEQTKKELAEAKQKLQLADPAKAKAIMYYEAMQSDYNHIIDAINKIDSTEDKTKLCAAVKKALQMFQEHFEKCV